jgi:transcriptional regulator with XRE-family HTH domain
VPEGGLEKAFGAVIRELREQRGLSQEDLSFACSRHRTFVSLIERGKSSPTITTLWRLAKALEVKPSEIIRRVERNVASA